MVLSLPTPLLALSLLGCGSAGEAQTGPTTFNQAPGIICQPLIEPADFPGGVIAFGLQDSLKPGDVIHLYQKEGFETFPKPVNIEEETWFFWIDEAPGGLFAHPTRFVYLTLAGGQLSVTEVQCWPVLNGRGLWLEVRNIGMGELDLLQPGRERSLGEPDAIHCIRKKEPCEIQAPGGERGLCPRHQWLVAW